MKRILKFVKIVVALLLLFLVVFFFWASSPNLDKSDYKVVVEKDIGVFKN